jgi:peptidoglycan/xylan/chitin deacetylase (PgdA/CDA1 family)
MVGCFDASLKTCPDWDLWQRIARTGARFEAIPDVLARYRMRTSSAGVNGRQILADALRIIARGHAADPRVLHPSIEYANGAPIEQLAGAKLHFACWAAGLVIGSAGDACPLLAEVEEDREPALDPHMVALMVFESTVLPTCRALADWADVWPGVEPHIKRFFKALESQSMAPGLAIRAGNILERLILDNSMRPRPLTIGRTHATRVEITEPIADLFPGAPAERLLCALEIEGKSLGTVELPICDEMVPGRVIADAIVADYAWTILGRFFERTLYPQLDVKRADNGVSVWRGGLCLTDGLKEYESEFWMSAHNRIGWAVFLQEIWGRPDWSGSRFYDSKAVRDAEPPTVVAGDWHALEVSNDLSNVAVSGSELTVVPMVGGVAVGAITVSTGQEVITADQLRIAMTEQAGFELCRAAVREGLLGKPLSAAPTSLRNRLAIAASSSAQPYNDVSLQTASDLLNEPSFLAALECTLPKGGTAVFLGQRAHEAIGTSFSRRAMLPAAAASYLVDAASVSSEVVIRTPRTAEQPDRVIYAPDLIGRAAVRPPVPGRLVARRSPKPVQKKLNLLVTRSRNGKVKTDRLPILMYHRVAPDGAAPLARYRVAPKTFEEQLRYLRGAGYHSVSLEDWRIAMKNERPLPGRAVILTFDDGYVDFMTYAWPLLKRYGFSAIVLLVAEQIGGTNHWDRAYGEEVPLLGWEQIHRLRDEGVEFGSHSARHSALSALSPAEIVCEGARSRAILERGLGQAVRTFAYPHGAEDRIVRHLIGACGYIFGLSCQPGLSGFFDPLLALPRVEVTGSDTLPTFVSKLNVAGA